MAAPGNVPGREDLNMKTVELMKHIPNFQYVRICEQMKIVGMGYPRTPQIEKFSDTTVGTFYIKNNVLEINVYER